MALTKCPDCATEISDAAPACVKCGRPGPFAAAAALGPVATDHKPLVKGCAVVFGVGLLVCAVIFAFSSSRTPHRQTQSTSTVAPQPGSVAPTKKPPNDVPTAEQRKRLLAPLKAERDQFQETTFYEYPGTPALETHVHLYISEHGDYYGLRFFAEHAGHDWIFWRSLTFRIDDHIYTLDASRLPVKRDNGSGYVWETLDYMAVSGRPGDPELQATETISPIVAAVMKGRKVSIRFEGERIEDHEMSARELDRFKKVGTTFFALFGMVDKTGDRGLPELSR